METKHIKCNIKFYEEFEYSVTVLEALTCLQSAEEPLLLEPQLGLPDERGLLLEERRLELLLQQPRAAALPLLLLALLREHAQLVRRAEQVLAHAHGRGARDWPG